MATLTPFSSSSSSGRDAPFRVAMREISLDFSAVGPEQSPHDLGALSESAFLALVEKFAALAPVKLIDGDPQLVVSAKRGRYIVLPSNGKLLLRPASDPQQPYLKFAPAEVPGFLDATDQQTPTPPPAPAKSLPTHIGGAESEATIPPTPAPIYGSFPSLVVRPVPAPGAQTAPAPPPPSRPADLPPKKVRRGLVYSALALFTLAAAASLWIFFGPAPAETPAPAGPPAEFDLVTAPAQLATLKKRFTGTYATSGEAGERLLEIRADGTFHYQEFGDGLARTANRTGTYTLALRHATKAPLLRTRDLGTIEIRDEQNLFCQQAVFTRLP